MQNKRTVEKETRVNILFLSPCVGKPWVAYIP